MNTLKRISALGFSVIMLFSCFASAVNAAGVSYKNYNGYIYTFGHECEDIEIVNYVGSEKHIVIPEEIYGEDVEHVKLQKKTKAESVVISEDAEFIRISQAPKLKKVEVSRQNDDFTARDGLVMNKRETVVYSVAGGLKNVKIPSGVVKIFHQAFVGSRVKNLTIGKDVTYIDTYAFYECKKLAKVTLTSTKAAPKIGVSAFEKTKGAISFYTKNKKVARQLKNRLLKSGLDTYRIYANKKLVYSR